MTWIAAVIVAGGAGLFLVAPWKDAAPTVKWRTATVDRADIRVVVSATGQLEPVSLIEVGAEISGKIATVEVDYNDRVEAGQVLARIDTESLESDLEQTTASLAAAVASVSEAEASLEESIKTVERTQDLAAAGVVSSSKLESAIASHARSKASLTSARAQQRLAQAKVQSVRTDLGKAVLKSPIAGVVLTREVEPGNTVVATMQSTTLFEIAENLSRMRLYADIDEADVGRVQSGQAATFTVDAWPMTKFDAKVTKVRLAPDDTNNVITYKAVLSVDNHEQRLRPGMTATVNIVAQTETRALRVPNAALRYTPPQKQKSGGLRLVGPPRRAAKKKMTSKNRVWVLQKSVPVPIAVELGVSDGRYTQIRSGDLDEGAKLLIGKEETP